MSTAFPPHREALARLLRAGLATGVDRASRLCASAWETRSGTLFGGASVLNPLPDGEFLRIRLSCRRPFAAEFLVLFSPDAAAAFARAVVGAGAASGSARMWQLPDPETAIPREFANIFGQSLIGPLADALHTGALLGVPKPSRGPAREAITPAFTSLGGKEPLYFRASASSASLGSAFEILLAFNSAEIFDLLDAAGVQ